MYQPSQNLLEGSRAAFPRQMFPWDDYFARMAETDFLCDRGDVPSVKSFFIRNAPFGGSFAVFGGITAALRGIMDVDFADPDFKAGMLDMGYRPEFVEWLAARKHLKLEVYAPCEGSVIFPSEPAVTVVGPLADIRFAEGILTEALNFPTLSMTKWYRLIRAVRPGRVLEFGRRRAQNAQKAALYGMLAGCFATSSSELRRFFDFVVSGTMGHEWIQSFGDVRAAFKAWLDHQPHKAIGLIDTKQCLEHDFPIWLDEVYNHREAIKAANGPIWGWRNDSGDLAYLTIEQYIRFFKHPLAEDAWFAERMRIVLTNDLDEYSAKSIIEQIRTQAAQAGLNAEDIIRRIIWAAGTKPSTCDDQPSLGGVAKLMEVEGDACIKLAFDADGRPGMKTSIPGFNRSALIRDASGEVKCVLIYPARHYEVSEGRMYDRYRREYLDVVTAYQPDTSSAKLEIANYSATPQQQMLFDSISGGPHGLTGYWDNPTIASVQQRVQTSVDQLHWSVTRIDNPHTVKVLLTPDLFDLRQRMINGGLLRTTYLP